MKPFIQDPQAWAAQSGYTLHRSPVDEKFLDVRKNETSIGVLVPDGENYQLYQAPVTTTSVSTAQEQVTDFISQSFTFGNPVEMHGLVNKGQKEFTLNEKVSGSGFVERISECNFWLPYAAEHYNISPDIRDYVLVPLPTINSGLPNTNGDSLSLNQMLRFDPQHGQQMYKTFRGKPTFLEHNHIWNDSKGVILDCYLRPIRGFGKGKHYKMVQLAAFDRSKDPGLANSILDGSNNAYSVGFSYKRYSCAVCGHTVGAGASSVACSHTRHMQPTYKDNSNRLVFRKCEEAIGIELSSVKNPAFAICVGPTVMDPRSI